MFVGSVREQCADIIQADKDQVEIVLIELGKLGDMCSVLRAGRRRSLWVKRTQSYNDEIFRCRFVLELAAHTK